MVEKEEKDSILTKFMIWVLKIKGFERWVLNFFEIRKLDLDFGGYWVSKKLNLVVFFL